MGSREGSDVACSEGICNHDEAGQDPADYSESFCFLLTSQFVLYRLKATTQPSLTALKTRRRMQRTAVWTAGRTLRKTVSAKAKRRRKRARASAAVRSDHVWRNVGFV